MLLKLVTICLAFMLLPTPAAAQEGAMTLRDAVDRAIRTNPDYQAAGHEKEAARQRLKQARAPYFPVLDLQAQAGWEKMTSPFTTDSNELWQRRGSLTLSQLLFDGLGTQSQVRGQEHRLESSGHRLREEGEFLGLDTVQAYLNVLRQRELLSVAEKNVVSHRSLSKKIAKGAEGGTMTQADASQAESRLKSAEAILSQVKENLKNAEALFLEKVGAPPGALAAPDVPDRKVQTDLQAAIDTATRENPALASLRADTEAARADYKSTSASFLPQINLELNGAEGRNEGGVPGRQTDFSALAVARWNLFRGGGDAARRQEYAHRYAETRSRAEAAARQIERDVRDTWAARESAENRARDYLTQARNSEKVFSAYLDQFNIARRTLLDVLNVQNEVFSSRSNYIDAAYAEKFALYRLLALEGRMLAALGVTLPTGVRQVGL